MGLLQINVTISKAFFLLGVFLAVIYLYIDSFDNEIIHHLSRLYPMNINILKVLFMLGVFLIAVYFYINSSDNEINYPDVRMGYIHKPSPDLNISHTVLSHSCKQNKSVESFQGFSSFPDRMKNFVYYRHCRHFPMLLDLPDKCGGADQSSDVFLLLVIKNAPDNYNRREILRKTWASERQQNGVWIRRVFITGTRGTGFEKERLNKILYMEQSQYKDILQWDIFDAFKNLTLKQVLFLEWMERNCPKVRFLFNGDDDVFVNTNNVVEYLQGLEDNDGSKHLCVGNIKGRDPTMRDPLIKYGVPLEVYEPEYYPPYCSGGGFLLTGYTASVIYNMSQSISLLPVDDVYIGMCLAKAGLRLSSHMGIKVAGVHVPSKHVNSFDPCFFKELLLVHGFYSENTYYMWQRINDPNLKCFGNYK